MLCSKCQTNKPETEFCINNANPSGLDYFCKDCKKWNPDTGACNDGYNSRLMICGPDWFCCFADPIDLEELKRRHKNDHDRLGKTGNRNSKGKSQK